LFARACRYLFEVVHERWAGRWLGGFGLVDGGYGKIGGKQRGEEKSVPWMGGF
jgi:hypothetical protein